MNRFSCSTAFAAVLLFTGLSSNLYAQRIVLKPAVQLQSGWVRLGHVATIETSNTTKRQILQSLPIRTFNGPSESVSKKEIADLLRSQGLDLVYWKLQGADLVRITEAPNSSRTYSTKRIQSPYPMATRQRNFNKSPESPPSTNYPSRHSLDDRSQIRRASGGWNGRPNWSRPARTVVTRPRPGLGNSPTEQRISNANFQSKEKKESFVWAAKELIPAGKIVMPSMLKSLKTTKKPDLYFQDASQLLGKETSFRISADQPIRRTSVRTPRVVRRNEKLRLYIGVGSISVSRTVIAEEDGGIGQTIKLRSNDRKKTYYGRIVRSGVVVMANPN